MEQRTSTTGRRWIWTTSLLLVVTAVPAVIAATPGTVAVKAVTVEPANPGPETLCKLSVKLNNGTARPVTLLVFRVRVNGQELAVYKNHVYMALLDSGKTQTLHLYNFWSTESGRPAPTDGFLTVEVTLVEARYADGKQEAVAGLPSSASVRLPFRSGNP